MAEVSVVSALQATATPCCSQARSVNCLRNWRRFAAASWCQAASSRRDAVSTGFGFLNSRWRWRVRGGEGCCLLLVACRDRSCMYGQTAFRAPVSPAFGAVKRDSGSFHQRRQHAMTMETERSVPAWREGGCASFMYSVCTSSNLRPQQTDKKGTDYAGHVTYYLTGRSARAQALDICTPIRRWATKARQSRRSPMLELSIFEALIRSPEA
jgi:hypothetical protein